MQPPLDLSKPMELIRKTNATDAESMLALINAAAQAYRGVIPEDRWREPYMSADELQQEIAGGVIFWIAQDHDRLLGVIGIQDRMEVELVRHAYVEPTAQGKGVGTRLLRHVISLARKHVLVGTWADATWAIEFYQNNGFTLVSAADKDRILRQYWSIPDRQIETSVVLAKIK